MINIRSAATKDIPALMGIMNHYRRHSNAIWTRDLCTAEDVRQWLREHSAPNRPALVAEEDGTLLGYASLSCFRPYGGYRFTAENSVYLVPGQESRGIGTALMKELLLRGKKAGLRVVTAWIDGENSASVAFHTALGFETVGTMKGVGVLDGAARDVVILQYTL